MTKQPVEKTIPTTENVIEDLLGQARMKRIWARTSGIIGAVSLVVATGFAAHHVKYEDRPGLTQAIIFGSVGALATLGAFYFNQEAQVDVGMANCMAQMERGMPEIPTVPMLPDEPSAPGPAVE